MKIFWVYWSCWQSILNENVLHLKLGEQASFQRKLTIVLMCLCGLCWNNLNVRRNHEVKDSSICFLSVKNYMWFWEGHWVLWTSFIFSFMWKKSFLPYSIADLANNKLVENFTNLCVSNVRNFLDSVFVSSLIKSVVTWESLSNICIISECCQGSSPAHGA